MTLSSAELAKVNKLFPPMREAAKDFLAEARGINAVITSSYRSLADQKKLYAKGRTTSGKIVTNSQPGYSYHNYGMAIDMAFDDKDPWSPLHPWHRLGEIGKAHGFEWGGDWLSPAPRDMPHFQMTFGWKVQQLYFEYKRTWLLAEVWKTISQGLLAPPGADALG